MAKLPLGARKQTPVILPGRSIRLPLGAREQNEEPTSRQTGAANREQSSPLLLETRRAEARGFSLDSAP